MIELKFLIIILSITFTTSQKLHQKSLLIVFDGTGSMGNNLAQLKPIAKEIVNDYSARDDKPIYDYILTVFNDPNLDANIVSTNPKDLIDGLERITPNGGGDTPEMALLGLQKALESALENSIAFLISDAPAKDYNKENEVANLIRKKQIKVFFLIEESCQTMTSPDCKVYENLARISGGQIIKVEKNKMKDFLKTVDGVIDPNHAVLMRIVSEAAGVEVTKDLNIDQSIQEVCASVTGKNPKISVLGLNSEHVNIISNLTMSTYKYVCIEDAQSGRYVIKVSADSHFEAVINARSSLLFKFGFSIEKINYLTETNIQPLFGHKNILTIFPTNSSLIQTLSDVTLITVPTNTEVKSVDFVYSLQKVNDDVYATEAFDIPKEPFKIFLRGTDLHGIPINREISSTLTIVNGSAPEMSIDSKEFEFCATQQAELNCRVKSQIPVNISWSFNGKIEKEINANQSKELTLNLNNLKISQKGVYKCQAVNEIGIISKEVTLNVFKVPKVKITSNHDILTEYLYYSFKCEVSDYDETPEVQWVDAGGVILSKDLFYNFTAQRKYEGLQVSCKAISKKCTVEDTKTYEILYKPKFLDTITDPIIHKTLNFNETYELNCETDRNRNRHRIEWILRTFDDKIEHPFENENLDKIEFRGIRKVDGIFECNVTNQIGPVVRQFDIKVEALAPPKIITKNLVKFNESERAQLACECQNCLPIANVTWTYENSSNIEISQVENIGKNHFQAFLHINKVDRSQGGDFKCKIVNSKGVDEKEMKLVIQTPPKIEKVDIFDGLENFKVDKVIEIKEDGNYTFSCFVESLPPPYIQWNFNGEKIKEGKLLTINKASLENEGSYECVAENIVKTSIKKFNISLKFKPKRKGEEKEVELFFTQKTDVTLDCEIYGNPQPEFKWKFEKSEIYDISYYEFRENRKILKFKVGSDDEGVFTCEGVNELGATSMDFRVTVRTAPVFIDPQDINIRTSKGSTLNLTCEANSFPPPQIKFLRNEKVIGSSSETFLTIQNIQMSDAGIYHCVAENNVDKSVKKFNVTVVELPKITSTFSNISLIEEESMEIQCEAKAFPSPTVQWFFSEILISDNGFLKLNTSFDRGFYTCRAENSEGSEEKSFYANITRLNPFKNISAIVTNITVKENEDFEIYCPFKNFESIKWTLNLQKIPNSVNFHRENNKLMVTKVGRDFGGFFSCHVSDNRDNSNFSYYIDVQSVPQVKASWMRNSENLNYSIHSDIEGNVFKLDEKLKMRCFAHGNPAPNVSWFKANEFIGNGSEFEFDKLQADDSGVYSCTAENSQAKVKKFFNVDVASAPHTDEFKVEIFTLKPNKQVILDCSKVKASPPPNFFWFKNKERLYSEKFSTLSIKNTNLTDNGDYLCLAFNSYGATEINFKISVLEPPKIIEPSSKSLIIVKNSTFSLTCVVQANPMPEFWWSSENILGMSGNHSEDIFKDNSEIYLDDHGVIIKNIEDHKLVGGISGISKLSKIDVRTFKFETMLKYEESMENKKFYCRSQNTEGSDHIEVNIQKLSKPHFVGTSFDDLKSTKLQFREGEIITLECPLTGSPKPNYVWKKDGMILSNKGNMLSYSPVLYDHSGNYSCTATNEEGSEFFEFEVIINTKPKFRNFSIYNQKWDSVMNIQVTKGNDAFLECWPEGNPKPEVNWFLTKLDRSWTKKNLNYSGNVYIRRNILVPQTVKCEIENIYGKNKREFIIEPVYAPEFRENIPIKTINVVEGGKISLSCDLNANPKAKLNWTQNSEPMKSLNAKDLSNKLILKRKNIQLHHNGTYTCTASNIYGKVNKTFHVIVHPHFSYSNWTRWSPCLSKSCSEKGVQYRMRHCHFTNISNTRTCPGENLQYRSCVKEGCYSDWLDWEPKCPKCFNEPHENVQFRSQRCLNPNGCGDDPPLYETRLCNITKCLNEENWKEWMEIIPCPKCYDYGQKKPTRWLRRTCKNDDEIGCEGSNSKEENCDIQICPKSAWSEWSDWSECDKSCGKGKQRRSRTCRIGIGKCGKQKDFEQKTCNIKKCR